MFPPADREAIIEWAATLTDATDLLVRTADGPQSGALLSWATALCDRVSNLRLKKMSTQLDSDPPAMVVNPRLHYRTVPDGPKLAAFLEALGGRHRRSLAPAVAGKFKQLDLLARLDVFIASDCPFCPQVIEKLVPLAFTDRPVLLSVIDCALFPETTAALDIRSVPTVILDGEFRWTGAIDPVEVVNVMVDRDPSALGADTLRSIIESGNASDIARMMANHGRMFDGIGRLLIHEKWPIRLGAMVTMEEWQALSPVTAAAAAEGLWRLYGEADETVKGDLLYTIGAIGDHRQEAALNALKAAPLAAELKEAAEDAIQSIRARAAASPGGKHGDSG